MTHLEISFRRVALATLVTASFLAADAREQMTINDGWKFCFGNAGDTTSIHLPHCWNDDAYRKRDYRRGEGTYIRQLRIPKRFEGKSVLLKLDGAASKSEIYIDGKKAGSHVGAYSSHTVDITDFVTPGGIYELKVKVDNSDRDIPPYSADFTFMGGLYRDVWLLASSPVCLSMQDGPDDGFKVVTDVATDMSTCSVRVSGNVDNNTASRVNPQLTVRLSDSRGNVIAEKKCKIKVGAGKSEPWSVDFGNLKSIRLWTPENPELYRVDVTVENDGVKVDESWCDTGFRTFGFDDEGRFMLNGQPYKLRGMCRHQDQRPMGIALTDEMHRRDMQLMKDMGTNFIRISHYPQDDAILEMCDRMGMIAWEEVPVIDYVPDSDVFADNCEIMLREMIRRHCNHPSVAMWGYMNEILLRMPRENQDETKARTRALAERLEKVLREEDDTRLSTMAFHGSDVYHGAGLGEITDVKGWNLYQGWYGGRFDEFEKYLSRQHREHPSHKLIVSEYGAGSDRRLHSLAPEAFDFSMEYQQDYLEHYLPVIEDSVFVAGASHWNFIDFSSANRAESMPHINNKGLVTNGRVPKDVYYYYSAAWHDITTDTIAHIAVRDWLVRTDIAEDGMMVTRPVKVYTNLPAVALRVNGTLLPEVAVRNCTAMFDVKFEDGDNVLELVTSGGEMKPLDVAGVKMEIIPVNDGRLDLSTGEFAVNVGSGCYFRSDESGLTWLPDREYAPGMTYGHVGGKNSVSQDEIACTSDTPLLQRARYGLDEYRVDVTPGRYEIELAFADLSSPSQLSAYMLGRNAGSGDSSLSSMDIIINGRVVEETFAPAGEAGVKTMVKRRYMTETDGEGNIIIGFRPNGGVTSLSALKIRKL